MSGIPPPSVKPQTLTTYSEIPRENLIYFPLSII